MLEPMNFARCGAEALSRESIIKPGCHPEPGREIAMPRLFFTELDQQNHQRLLTRSSPNRFRLATTLALSIIVLNIGILSEQPGRLNAGEQPLAGTQVRPGTPDTSSNFVAGSHTALKKVHMDLEARMELEKAKLKKLEEPFQNRRKPIREERILTLLDQAIPIEERLQAKLTQAETGQVTGDALRKEVADLTNQFQALIERALAVEAAADWDRLKPSIHQAAIQAGARPPK
jgi:hypothetical protein